MKLFLLAIPFFFINSSFAADVLTCWNVKFHPNTPLLTATILNNHTLSDLRFNYSNWKDKSEMGVLTGQLITSNHSPYKGAVQYSLQKSGFVLNLPSNLSNENLTSVEANGIGEGKGENGAIIGFAQGDCDGGCHISTRLSCRSTK